MRFFKNPYTVLLFACVAYFSSDFIDKGIILNQLTVYPILGWLMWGGIAFIIWIWILQPIIQFSYMRSSCGTTALERANIILNSLKNDTKREENNINTRFYREIRDAKVLLERSVADSEEAKKYTEKLNGLLTRYYEESNVGKKARKLILKYSKIGGLGVVFSRNHWMDGIIMLIIQMKLVLELAKLYGYKPSPVFNMLCFGWILVNSLVSCLLSQDGTEDLGDTFVDNMVELYTGEDELVSVGADLIGTKLLSMTISSLLEAIMSGTSVYITGYIFLRKLENDGRKLNFYDFIKLRRKGRLELGKTVIKEIPNELVKKISEKTRKGIVNIFSGEYLLRKRKGCD